MTGSSRRLLAWRVASTALGVLTTAAALVLLLRDDRAREAVGLLTVPALGVALLLGVGNVTADSYRFHWVLPAAYRGAIGLWHWHRIYSTGRLLNMLVPQLGGAYRAAQLRIDHGLPVATFYGSVAATTGLGTAFSWVFAGAVVASQEPLLGSLVLGAGIASLVGFAVVVRRLGRSRAATDPTGDRRSLARRFADGFLDLADKRRLSQVLGFSLLGQIGGALALVVIAAGLGVESPLVVGAALHAATSLGAVISMTPGGIGISELGAALAAHLVDLGAGVGVLIALVARVTGMAAGVIVALMGGIMERRRGRG